MDRRRAAAALLALAACIACSAAAPTASNTALELHDGPVEGCYYNFQHYGEGDRIMTNEPCLNCTCHNRMLMCYLRVCPFTKAIGQDCTVEKRADQCCPIVTCPDVPVDLLTSTSTSSPAEYGATGLGKLDKYGCSINGKYFPEGSKVPPMPNKPCEHCYCIRNMTTCVMQECTLHVDGCTPIYHKDVCCPVRYSCDHPEDEIPLLDDMTTTVRPTPGFLLTTTTTSPVTQMSQDCVHDDQIFPDGALIKTEKACEHCYCMKGDIVCVVQECGTPMENEGKNCASLPPRHGQCCPDTYICEGDERVPDSTTEIIELTSSPPRRVGVEGSGYRNEPDEPYTEINVVTTEIEGSGGSESEGFTIFPQIDTGDNETPEKETPNLIDETLLTTTKSSLQVSQSTEPDKGQNTIPDSVIDNESPEDKVTPSSSIEPVATTSEEYITSGVGITEKDVLRTTESVLSIDNESITDVTLSSKDETFRNDMTTTVSTDSLGKTTFVDDHTYHKEVGKDTTTPTTEYTDKYEETSKQEEISTDTIVQSVTEKDKLSGVSQVSTETDTFIEFTTNPVTTPVVSESTSVNTNINEVDDNISPILSPSRIPGEGDCLLSGVTYSNNSEVPSTNNCHISCKCISSIIKCDPIICSPLPEYMENMNDCQAIYDTPNSCCPTYVCSVKETIPPESHSHMSGTESPKPITAIECSGDDCIEKEGNKQITESSICTAGNCLSETPAKQKCESNNCKDQTEISPAVSSQDCLDEKCQLPVVPCEGENCKIDSSKGVISDKDLESTKPPSVHECEANECNDQIQTKPQDCSDDKCNVLPTTPCEGKDCNQLETSSLDIPICNKENGCDESNILGQDECNGENCRRKDFTDLGEKTPSKCSGSECKLHDEPSEQPIEQGTPMVNEGSSVYDIDIPKTEELYTTTITEKLTDLDIDVTKQPIHMESPENLSTQSQQIVTETSHQYEVDKEFQQTDVPLIHTSTDTYKEDVTKPELLQTELPKLSITYTTGSQEIYRDTDERITTGVDLSYTKQPEYLETDTEISVTVKVEQDSTVKPHIYTETYEPAFDEEHTKSSSDVPIVTIPEKEEDESKEIETKTLGTLSNEIVTTESTQITLSEVMYTEKHTMLTETPELDSATKEYVTRIPEIILTVKEEQQTGVPNIFTDNVSEDIQTKAPERYATEKDDYEIEILKITVPEKEIAQTDTPDVVGAVNTESASVTESAEVTDKEVIEDQTIQTKSPEFPVTTKKSIDTETHEPVVTEETQTETEIVRVTKKEDEQKDITEIATEKEVTEVSALDQHEVKPTTAQDFDITSVEGQTTSLKPESVDDEIGDITKDLFVTQFPPTITEKTEITGKDTSHELIKPEDLPTKDVNEIATARTTYIPYETETKYVEADDTKSETIPGDTHEPVTDSIKESSPSDEIGKTTTKETQIVTEEQEIYTESPHKIVTKLEEVVTTDKGLLYTLNPELHETKHDDVLNDNDQSVSKNPDIITQAPEIIASEYAESTTARDKIVTDKFEDNSVTYTELTSQPSHEIADKQEKVSESPEMYVTTNLREQYTMVTEEIVTEISTKETHATSGLDSQLYDNDIPDKFAQTTKENVERLTTADNKKFTTEIPNLYSTEPEPQTSTSQKLDLVSPNLTTLGEKKEPATSTDALDLVSEISKTSTKYPELQDEKQQDLTTESIQHETTGSYEETGIDNLSTYSPQKDKLSSEQQHPIDKETSFTKAVTDSYVEMSTKLILEEEKVTQDETKEEQTTRSEVDLTLLFTKSPDLETVTQLAPDTYTIKKEESVTSTDSEKEVTESDDSLTDIPEDSTLQEGNLPEHTVTDLLTTPVSLEVSSGKTDKNIQDSNEMSTKVSEFITTSKYIVTTESQIIDTSSDLDKLLTTVVDKAVQEEYNPEQEPDHSYKTTTLSPTPEDFKKITKQPMSLVTHIGQDVSSFTTSSDKVGIIEEESKTPVDQKLNEEKLQTTVPEIYDTELQKQSTEYPDHHNTQQEMETESPSKLNTEDSMNYVIDLSEKTTASVVEDQYSLDHKTTVNLNQQSDLSKDISSTEKIELTPISDSQEAITDTSQKTTESVPLEEKDPESSHQHETPVTESVSELETKSPNQIETDFKDITTPSILLDNEHVLSTEAILIEQQSTKLPDIDVHDKLTIPPETEKPSVSEGVIKTESPKISTEKETEASTTVYAPIVTEITETPLETEVQESGSMDREQKPTETVIKFEEKTTPYIHLETVTGKDSVYSHNVPTLGTTESQYPVYSTHEGENGTETPVRATEVPDLFTITQISSELPKQQEFPETTDISDKEITDEHVTSPSLETSTLITETQTKSVDDAITEKQTSKPITTVRDTEIQSEKYSPQPDIVTESSVSELMVGLSKEPEKEVEDAHAPIELTPTTTESSYTEETRKEYELSDKIKPTTEPIHEFSETTPFLVELKEHTHQVVDESSRTPEEMLTTAYYKPEQTDRGDQNLDVTDKYEDEYQTSSPTKVTKYELQDKEKLSTTTSQDETEHKIPSTGLAVTEVSEHVSDIEITNTTPSVYSEADLREHEKQPTTSKSVLDVVITTTAAPQIVSEKELYTTVSTDEQKLTYTGHESSSVSPDKDISIGTEEPLKSEASVGTTLLDDDNSLRETSKITTSKIKEEPTTQLPLTDKSAQPEEKPIRTTHSPPTQELTKPAFDDEINEGIPSPDFPPSGAGGYGQEPDYIEEDQAFGPGTCRYGGKVYVSAQQIPRDDPCDFCFCFRSDIICLQQSCPPPIHGCHEEPIQGFCCPRYECPVSMATTMNVTTTTTTTTTTLPPHFLPHAYKGAAQRRGCQIKGHTYKVGEVVRASSGPCLHCTCGGDGQMKCDPKACTPEPMLRQMIAAAVSAKRRR